MTFKYSILLFLAMALSHGQAPVVEWQELMGGNSHDLFRRLVLANDGGYLLAGHSSSNISGDKNENSFNGPHYWIIKIDSNRNIEWQRTLGSATLTSEGDGQEYFSVAIQTADDGFLVGGWSGGGISGNKTEANRGLFDYWIVKLDANGNTQWQKAYGGSDSDQLSAAQQTADGGYILAGSSRSSISGEKSEGSRGLFDGWIIKIDALGEIQWQKTLGGSSFDLIGAVAITTDDGYVIAGYSASPVSGEKTEPSYGGNDYWVLKLDESGNIQWQKTIGGSGSDMLDNIVQTTDGGYLMAGSSNSPASGLKTENSRGGDDYWLVKLDPGGEIQWQKTYGGNNEDSPFAESVAECENGYIVAGSSLSDISGEKAENSKGGRDAWVLRLDLAGEILWQKTIGGTLDDGNNNVFPTADGGFILGGVSRSSNTGDITQTGNGSSDYWIVKLAPEALSVPRHENWSAHIYPNPTTGHINIGFEANAGNTNVALFDLSGREISRQTYLGESSVLGFAVSGSDGIYFLKIQNQFGTKTYKVIKKQ